MCLYLCFVIKDTILGGVNKYTYLAKVKQQVMCTDGSQIFISLYTL